MLLRTSERTTFLTCRVRWDFAYNQRLAPKTASPALRFGRLVHLAMAAYYKKGIKRGRRPALTFEKLYKAELEEQTAIGFIDEEGKWQDSLELGLTMLKGYVDHWGKDEEWEVLHTEVPFQVEVFHPKTERYLFTYVGTLDGVWRNRSNKQIWIPDHKTTAKDPTKQADALVLDDQVAAYWTYGVDWLLAEGVLKPKDELRGMMFNFLKKQLPDTRERNAQGQYLNQNGSVSKQQPSPWYHRERTYRGDIERERARVRIVDQAHEMHLARQGKLPIYINPGPAYKPNCQGCAFKDPCQLREAGANYKRLIKAQYEEWDPYSEHELYERS